MTTSAVLDRLHHCRFWRQPVGGEIDEIARAEVVEHEDAALAAERAQGGVLDRRGKALNLVVRLMDLHRGDRVEPDVVGIVAQMRTVRGADLLHPAAGSRHDVRDAKGATDLDQLAARDEHLLVRGKRGEDEQNRCGVVVDDRRGLGACEAADERLEVIVALATFPGCNIELEVGRAGKHPRDGLGGLGRQQRATQVGMQHCASEIEDAPQRRAEEVAERVRSRCDQSGLLGGLARLARCRERLANRLGCRFAAIGFGKHARLWQTEQAVDRG